MYGAAGTTKYAHDNTITFNIRDTLRAMAKLLTL